MPGNRFLGVGIGESVLWCTLVGISCIRHFIHTTKRLTNLTYCTHLLWNDRLCSGFVHRETAGRVFIVCLPQWSELMLVFVISGWFSALISIVLRYYNGVLPVLSVGWPHDTMGTSNCVCFCHGEKTTPLPWRKSIIWTWNCYVTHKLAIQLRFMCRYCTISSRCFVPSHLPSLSLPSVVSLTFCSTINYEIFDSIT